MDRNWTDLLGRFVEDFVSAAQCAAHTHKALTIGVGSTKKTPEFVKRECNEGKFSACTKKLIIDECSVLNNCAETIKALEWINAPRQGIKAGRQNTQLELGISMLPVNEVMRTLQVQLETCKLHQAEYMWHNRTRQIDLTMSDRDTTRVICTDFGATLDLGAAEKDNYSVDNHSVICIFVLSITGG